MGYNNKRTLTWKLLSTLIKVILVLATVEESNKTKERKKAKWSQHLYTYENIATLMLLTVEVSVCAYTPIYQGLRA
jgi:membrane-associated HD superfamily phosphohydrolase